MPAKKPKQPNIPLKQAYQDLRKAHLEIKEAHMAIVLRLAIIAEYRDPETGTHIIRISDYGCVIARELGLSDEEIEIYRFSSPLHDIGKIAMPDSILKKKGKLTVKEKETMNQHTLVGARMFQGATSPILRAASEICHHHHERWDGKGYPEGLKGEKIPRFARIVTIADIFDALLSKRCYKDAWPFDDAVKYVRENSGKIFDPRMVNAFNRCLPSIRKIYDANKMIQSVLSDAGIVEKLTFSD